MESVIETASSEAQALIPGLDPVDVHHIFRYQAQQALPLGTPVYLLGGTPVQAQQGSFGSVSSTPDSRAESDIDLRAKVFSFDSRTGSSAALDANSGSTREPVNEQVRHEVHDVNRAPSPDLLAKFGIELETPGVNIPFYAAVPDDHMLEAAGMLQEAGFKTLFIPGSDREEQAKSARMHTMIGEVAERLRSEGRDAARALARSLAGVARPDERRSTRGGLYGGSGRPPGPAGSRVPSGSRGPKSDTTAGTDHSAPATSGPLLIVSE
jgi:hypothetical protein